MTAATDLPELQKGQLKVASSFGFCFLGGGLLDFLPILYNKAKEGAPGSLQVCPQLSACTRAFYFQNGRSPKSYLTGKRDQQYLDHSVRTTMQQRGKGTGRAAGRALVAKVFGEFAHDA